MAGMPSTAVPAAAPASTFRRVGHLVIVLLSPFLVYARQAPIRAGRD
jgi:hypothetical protein